MASQKCGFSTRTGDNFGRDLHFDRERERDSKDAKQATVLVPTEFAAEEGRRH